jgi:LacI family transcriptional regulator, kdg operon repressor
MVNQSVTIKDVAKAAGVSITTVSRYLNRRYDSMSVETRERIEKVIEELNYQPNKMAQGLKGQTRTIAVVVVNLGYPFAVGVIRSISSVLSEMGYAMLVGESAGDTAQEAQLLQSLISQGVDGIIIQTSGQNNDLLADIALEKPVVLVDRQFDVPGVTNVITNNHEASRELTERLLLQGYQHVVFVSEPPSNLSTRVERLGGYLEACRAAGVSSDPRWVLRDDPASMTQLAEQLFQNPPKKPFAVYTANGLVMLDLYPKLMYLPYSVPTEMGIATFDEPDWVQVTHPRLTCVRQPTDDIGMAAADTVLEQLRERIGQVFKSEPTVISRTARPTSGSGTTRPLQTSNRPKHHAPNQTMTIPSEVIWGESSSR